MKITTPKLKKLNSFGVSHIIVPVLAVLAIGGIGTYLLGIDHADAAVPYLVCKTVVSPAAGTTLKGNGTTLYNINVTTTFTNNGGGKTGVINNQAVPAFVTKGPVTITGKFTESDISWSNKVPALVHAQTFTDKSTLEQTGFKRTKPGTAELAIYVDKGSTRDGCGALTLPIK